MNFLGDSTLTGQIVDAQTKLPLVNASIFIRLFDQEAIIAQTTTDANGQYNFSRLPSSEHLIIEVTAPDYVTESETLVLLSNKNHLLHYDLVPLFIDPCRNGEKLEIRCFLTDANGVQKKTITFTEIGRRSTIQMTLPNGEVTDVQKITALLRGFVVVEVVSEKGTCRSNPIPFQQLERFVLWAPEGTGINFSIDAYECEATIICEENEDGIPTFQELTVSISLCESLTSLASSVIEMKGNIIQPRTQTSELLLTSFLSSSSPPSSQNRQAMSIRIKKMYDWVVRNHHLTLTLNRKNVSFHLK
ncbi:carboxypeptidase-like regulatory domain-containing protein [Bacillus sp. CGMCC 1.16541]|uniref:carboxypeptidase-like regulatory domain-containing protein n=1 Tax=Bacillus sp. CGMCC 1.16541 TaxID=2185143 RepID=UPI0013A561D7|nr:carboxypeptidase-like regulatory domain-containing protein [Bacillus sp. CGMCC 1.16541]